MYYLDMYFNKFKLNSSFLSIYNSTIYSEKKKRNNFDFILFFIGYDFTLSIYKYSIKDIFTSYFDNLHLSQTNFTNLFNSYRQLYDIDSFLIFKFDALREHDLTNQTEYIFYDYNESSYIYSEIDVSKFNNINITNNYPIKNISNYINILKDAHNNNINLFNISDPFFNDICFIYTSEKGRDITIEDRRKDYYLTINFCENNCSLIEFDYNNFNSKCNCKLKTKFSNVIEMSENYSQPEFKKVKNVNILFFKCSKEILKKKNIINNTIFWIFLFIIFFQFITILWCLYSENSFIENYLKNHIKAIKNDEEININKLNNINNNNDNYYNFETNNIQIYKKDEQQPKQNYSRNNFKKNNNNFYIPDSGDRLKNEFIYDKISNPPKKKTNNKTINTSLGDTSNLNLSAININNINNNNVSKNNINDESTNIANKKYSNNENNSTIEEEQLPNVNVYINNYTAKESGPKLLNNYMNQQLHQKYVEMKKNLVLKKEEKIEKKDISKDEIVPSIDLSHISNIDEYLAKNALVNNFATFNDDKDDDDNKTNENNKKKNNEFSDMENSLFKINKKLNMLNNEEDFYNKIFKKKNFTVDEKKLLNKLNKNFNFCFKLFRYFKKREILLLCITNEKDNIPSFSLWSLLFTCISMIFALYCLFFNENYIHKRYIEKSNTNFIYFLKNEINLCLLCGLISIVIKMILIKFLMNFVYGDLKLINNNNKNIFINQIRCKLFIFYVIILMIFIFSVIINISYGGIFINSNSAFIEGFIFSYIFSFIFCLIICILITILFKIKNCCNYVIVDKIYKILKVLY